jgi:glycosyltransferase involved in cell wall biosynthesis
MKIIIWTGEAWETWGPHSIIEGGIGGSETAVIHMAAQLARMGHEVIVSGQVVEGEVDGVTYVDRRGWRGFPVRMVECDIFISSRDWSIVRDILPQAKLKILWMHDLHMGEDTEDWMLDFDRIFVLSKYALQYALKCYPHVPLSKYVVTRNGIDPSLFLLPGETLDHVQLPEKVGCKAIYSSSYDRGLDRLLTFWPKIRTLCPEAELHVYYGFNTAEKQVAAIGRKSDLLMLEFQKHRLAEMADFGVVSHGRVGQRELAKAFLESSLWLYPTNFHETSCITAMEAQAAGAFAITSRLAALPETLKMGHLIEPPNTTAKYEAEFLDAIKWFIEAREHDVYPNFRLNRRWALRDLSWQEVASEWDIFFVCWLAGDFHE